MSPHQDPNSEVSTELSRDLTLFQLTMMGAGMMIGAGVFVATGIATGIAGTGGIIIAFALNGVIALLSAMSMAELASAIPSAGGVYAYIREAFGGIVGFISGWMNWFALAIAGSLYAITFASYTMHLLVQIDMFSWLAANPDLYQNLMAIGIAGLFVLVNYLGASESGGSASMIALAQTLTLGLIGVIGIIIAFTQPERLANLDAFVPHGWGSVLAAMGFTYIGFEGYEVITHAGEEAINPKKDVPKAILYSLIIVVTTYLLIAFAVVVGAPTQGADVWMWFAEMGELGVAEAISGLFPFGGVFISLAAIFASTSALNATTYSATRVAFDLGRQKELPPILARISETRRIPDIALFLTGAIIIPVAVSLPIKDVAASTDIMFLLLFLLVNVSVIKVRRDKGEELNYSFVMPFFPYVPLIAIVAQSALAIKLFDVSLIAWATTIIWLVAGLAIYLGYTRKQIQKTTTEPSPVLEERRALRTRDYQVMVPVANAHNASTLARWAEKIAIAKDAEMVLLNVLTLPEQTPIEEAERFFPQRHEILVNTRKQIEHEPVHSLIRYGRNVANSIIASVAEKDTDLLVLGWKGRFKPRYFEMGSNLDAIIERVTSDCIVIKPGVTEDLTDERIKSILVPTNGGFHSQMSAEIASILGAALDAEITVYNVNSRGDTREQIQSRLDIVLNHLDDERTHLKISDSEDVVCSIVDESTQHDLVIMGATEEGYFQQLLFGKISERVAAECHKTVIMVKKNAGLRSVSRQWLGRREYLKRQGVAPGDEESN